MGLAFSSFHRGLQRREEQPPRPQQEAPGWHLRHAPQGPCWVHWHLRGSSHSWGLPPSLLTLRMAKAGRRGQNTPLPLQIGQEQVCQVAEASPQHFTTLRSSEEAQTGLWLLLKRVQHRGMGRRCHGGEGGEDANSGKEEPTAEKWTWSLCQGRQRGWSLPGVTPLPMAVSRPHFFPSPRVAGAG